MLPTKEEQEKVAKEILFDTLYAIKPVDEELRIMKKYAKWYATEIIKHCSEVAESKLVYHSIYDDPHDEVDKQSILDIINEL